ncbi:hypothetical protein RHMOL_Rhmol05G0000100 [Rhododendron molle]|uniref:Uncharacterized protein n=1 Tax=Rhododendron molle TaxID=49168 RepID=A0ACC0NJ36_RHOML|nr:hypothetical protein RHMOL_Rhmol05G0000100 [Rhododendron molle]
MMRCLSINTQLYAIRLEGITKALRYLHENCKSHGNLRNGAFISLDGEIQVVFANFDTSLDKWVPSLPSFKIFSLKPPWLSCNKVADFINPVSYTWRVNKLRQGAFLVEASVFRDACLFAKALAISRVTIENDNAQLISLSVSELVPPWEALAFIANIKTLASEAELAFSWTPREGNEVAHSISSSFGSSLDVNWMGFPPPGLSSILCDDVS